MNPLCKIFEKVRRPLPYEQVVSSNRLKCLRRRQMLPRKKLYGTTLFDLMVESGWKDQEYLKGTYEGMFCVVMHFLTGMMHEAPGQKSESTQPCPCPMELQRCNDNSQCCVGAYLAIQDFSSCFRQLHHRLLIKKKWLGKLSRLHNSPHETIWSLVATKYISNTKRARILYLRKWFEPRSNIPWLKKIIWVIGVLSRTVVSDWRFDNLCGSHLQSQDSEDGFRTGCRNVSHKQQSFSGL